MVDSFSVFLVFLPLNNNDILDVRLRGSEAI